MMLIFCVDFSNQIAMNTEECSRTLPSLVSTQTAVCSLTSVLCRFPKSFIPGGFFAQ